MRASLLSALVAVVARKGAAGDEIPCFGRYDCLQRHRQAFADAVVPKMDPHWAQAREGADESEERARATVVCDRDAWAQMSLCQARCPTVLQVTAPQDIAGDYCYADSGFAPHEDGQHVGVRHPLHGVELELVTPGAEASATGCNVEDYAGLNATGKLVVVRRGACWFQRKAVRLAALGAAGGLVLNTQVDESLADQLLRMTGTSAGFPDLPLGLLPAYYEGLLLRALRRGDVVTARFLTDCDRIDAVAGEEHQATDGCPHPLMFNENCRSAADPRNQLCTQCPGEVAFHTGAHHHDHEHTHHSLCLWGNALYPRVAASYIWTAWQLPSQRRVAYLSGLARDGCDASPFDAASVAGAVVFVHMPRYCVAFTLIVAAKAAQAAAVVFIHRASAEFRAFPSGPASFATIPVHSTGPWDHDRVVAMLEGRGTPLPLQGAAAAAHPDAVMTVLNGTFVPSVTSATSVGRAATVPATGMPAAAPTEATQAPDALYTHGTHDHEEAVDTAVVVSGVLAVVLLATVAVKVWGSYVTHRGVRAGLGDDHVDKARSIPLCVASTALSVSLIMGIVTLTVWLVGESGARAVDGAVRDGGAAVGQTYAMAVRIAADVESLRDSIHTDVLMRVCLMVSATLTSGERLAAIGAALYYDFDDADHGAWNAFAKLYPRLVDVGLLYPTWVVAMKTPEGFHASPGIRTDDRPDAARQDGLPHVSVTDNGTLYGTVEVRYNAETKHGEVFAAAFAAGEGPYYYLGGEPSATREASAIAAVRGREADAKLWHLSRRFVPQDTTLKAPKVAFMPITVLTPAFTRDGSRFVGAFEANLPLAALRLLLRNTLVDLVRKNSGLRNTLVLCYDVPTRAVLATSRTATPLGRGYAVYPYSWPKAAERLFTLDDHPHVEVTAFGAASRGLQSADEPIGGSDAAVNAAVSWAHTHGQHSHSHPAGAHDPQNTAGDIRSGSYEQGSRRNPSAQYLELHLQPAGTVVQDRSGNAYDFEFRNVSGHATGCATPAPDAGSCPVGFDAAAGEATMAFDGATVLHIYRNLTEDLPTAADLPQEAPELTATALLPGGRGRRCLAFRETTLERTGQAGAWACLLRRRVPLTEYTVAATVKPAAPRSGPGLTHSAQVLFAEGEPGQAALRLYADGGLRLGAGEFGCSLKGRPDGLPLDVWTSVLATLSMQRRLCEVYINGTLHAAANMSTLYTDEVKATAHLIGRGYTGQMGEVRVYNTSMIASEVAGLVGGGGGAVAMGVYAPAACKKQWYFCHRALKMNDENRYRRWGLDLAVAALFPRDDTLLMLERNHMQVQDNLLSLNEHIRSVFRRDQRNNVLLIFCATLFVTLVFLYFNEMITLPFTVAVTAMQRAAVLQLDTVPSPTSTITELNSLYSAISLMLRNLRTYKSFMPHTLLAEAEADADPGDDSPSDQDVATDVSSVPRDVGQVLTALASSSTPGGPMAAAAATGSPARTHAAAPAVASPVALEARGEDGTQDRPSRARSTSRLKSRKRNRGASVEGELTPRRAVASRLPAVVPRSISVCIANVLNFQSLVDKAEGSVVAQHAAVLSEVLAAFSATRGVPDVFSGDRFTGTFNAVRARSRHQVAAADAALLIRDRIYSELRIDMTASVATGEAKVGNIGAPTMKRFAYLGPVATWAYALERLNTVLGTQVLVDTWVYQHVAGRFSCRLIDEVAFPKRDALPIRVHELMHKVPDRGYEEWLYELDEDAEHTNPYRMWNLWVASCLAGDWAAARQLCSSAASLDSHSTAYRKMLRCVADGQHQPIPLLYH